MAVRIALQCSETDAHLILSEDNSAARLLSRPGEAIYNDSNGLVEGNHPFQVVWLPDERREHYLECCRSGSRRPVSSPGRKSCSKGTSRPIPRPTRPWPRCSRSGAPPPRRWRLRIWLGDAVAIKDPDGVEFRRQSGGNLLLVGQNDEAPSASWPRP